MSTDLKLKIFNKKVKLKPDEFSQKFNNPEHEWLDSFVSIREKIHQLSNVEMFHVNKHEA